MAHKLKLSDVGFFDYTKSMLALGRGWQASGAILCLIALNSIVFSRHYWGDFVFPWDFGQGYHAMAYAWYLMLDWFEFPQWIPYGSMGYPSHLALQDSAYYPPLLLFRMIGGRYTYHAAVVFQGLHILFGAIGICCLLRAQSLSWKSALLGAVAFHLSAGFFSNSQHVDIVRAYAWMPWVFMFLTKRYLVSANRFHLVAAIFVFFCFLIVSYPGVLIAFGYCGGAYFAAQILLSDQAESMRRTYVMRLVITGGVALLLSAPKLLPFLIHRDELIFQPGGGVFYPAHLLTLVFPFDQKFLPGDITMRSLYVAPAILAFLFFLNISRWRCLTFAWLLVLITALVMLFDSSLGGALRSHLPGLNISRFPLSDFRIFLHLSIIILACIAIDDLANGVMKLPRLDLGAGFSLLWIAGMGTVALMIGYSFADLIPGGISFLTGVACALLLGLSSLYKRWHQMNAAYIILYISVLASWLFWHENEQVWAQAGRSQLAAMTYGISEDALFSAWKSGQKSWPLRPARINVEFQPFINRKGLIGLYTQQFATRSYDAGERLWRTQRALDQNGSTPSGQLLMQFLISRSTWLMLNPSDVSDGQWVLNCLVVPKCEPMQGVEVSMRSFKENGSIYWVSAKAPFVLVENEMYFPGWRGTASAVAFDSEIEAFPLENILRAWRLPAGDYEFITHFQAPGWNLSLVLFSLGVLGVVVIVVGGPPRSSRSSTEPKGII